MHWPAQLWLAACRLATLTKELFPLHLRSWQLWGLFWLIVLLVTKKNTNKTKSSSNLKHVSADPASCCCFFHFLFVCVCVCACVRARVSLSVCLSFCLFCFVLLFVVCLFLLTSLIPCRKLGSLHSSCKSSASHSYPCVQYFCVRHYSSRLWGFL